MTERRSGALDIESAAMTVYRLYSVGDEIDLDVAERCLAQSSSRARHFSGAGQSEKTSRSPRRRYVLRSGDLLEHSGSLRLGRSIAGERVRSSISAMTSAAADLAVGMALRKSAQRPGTRGP